MGRVGIYMRIGLSKSLLTILILPVCICLLTTGSASAAKKSKGGKIDTAAILTSIDELTTKIYASALFSPQDNSKLIQVKLKLDNAMLNASNPEFAPLYYKAGTLYQKREYRELAIDCYQTILENFSDTALAPKARKELSKMGIIVKAAENEEDSEE